MRWPVQNFETDWYSAQAFGAKTGYGPHDGEDLNLKSGGDTDLGQPIYAIADGVVTSVHAHSTVPSFGKHLHIKHVSLWGTCWSHYAHCLEILVKEGDNVTEGQRIALVGKTGTTLCHLHFAIKREATGVDAVAKTVEDLKKWHDPLEFIRKWQGNPENDDISIVRAKRDENWNLYVDAKKSLEDVQTKYRTAEAMAQSYGNFFTDICEIIKPEKRDIPTVIGRVTTLCDKETLYSGSEEKIKKLGEEIKALTQANTELERRLGALRHQDGEIKVEKMPSLWLRMWRFIWQRKQRI